MQKGTVKWFNPTKGYGFIKPSSGDKDVFVHISALERAGLRTLNEGQEVEYELVTNRGRTSAENLKVAKAGRVFPDRVAPGRFAGGFAFCASARVLPREARTLFGLRRPHAARADIFGARVPARARPASLRC